MRQPIFPRLLAACLLIAPGLAAAAESDEAKNAAPARPAGPMVSVARAKIRCFSDQVDVTGVLVPRQEVQIRPDRDGLRVTQVYVKALDEVRAGQALAQLSPEDGQPGGPTTLRAPVSGLIGRSTATVGAPAPARRDPLFVIAAQGEVDLAAEAPLAKLERLAPGQGVSVKPIGLSPLKGKIRLVSPVADPATQLGQVRIQLASADGIRLGLFARGTVQVGESCGIAIPFSALVRGPDGPAVYVSTGHSVEVRPVGIGLFSEDEIEIRSGLSENDRVIVRAAPFLREGDAARPVEIAEPRKRN
ncbi:efflux RND transporter periplasmic adaptor subunit [Methylobacterium aquaticum]|uniref:efflux RND transporter periplasmic adaptor subunit n=1 Tax=Methylobacterium aquaticum TaxID=270351 RepID=UPI00069F09BB|nr:efflux RND transporter periplasmic adaptor subunit [Methylobacterium aquaticum]